ncbi:MAG: alpha/beta hydrolase [Silanimonas sp.]
MNTLSSATLRTAIATGLLAAATSAAAEIRTQTVRFDSNGDTLVGTLYLPEGTAPSDAVVVTGAWMTVKEQMAGRYAEELAERGIAALAFDFRGWGESEGRPRALENPERKTQDIVAASIFLQQQLPGARISGLGICASAGSMAEAATRTPVLSRVALVAPWLHDAAIVDQVYGGAEGVATLIAAGRTAEAQYAETGTEVTVPAASTTDSTAVMFQVPYYTEADRGLIPQWENRFNVASWEGWLRFDALKGAATLTQPLLIVHSEAAAIPQGAKQFYAAVNAPKQQRWLDGVGQLDFYDRDAPVDAASDAVATFVAQP